MALITLGANSGKGKVLQVVQGSTATQVVHSTSYADTGLTASITPSSSSNKILVILAQHLYTSGSSGTGGAIKLLRDSTAIYTAGNNQAYYINATSADMRNYHSFNYLDSPSSTSSLTYKTQGISYSSAALRTQNDGHFTSFITLMEVAG